MWEDYALRNILSDGRVLGYWEVKAPHLGKELANTFHMAQDTFPLQQALHQRRNRIWGKPLRENKGKLVGAWIPLIPASYRLLHYYLVLILLVHVYTIFI